MPRKRTYPNAAARQAAYRARLTQELAEREALLDELHQAIIEFRDRPISARAFSDALHSGSVPEDPHEAIRRLVIVLEHAVTYGEFDPDDTAPKPVFGAAFSYTRRYRSSDWR